MSHPQVPSRARALMPWLLADQATIVDAVFWSGQTLFDLAEQLERDPMEVLRYLAQCEVMQMVDFDCEPGSEEEVELFGLALSGVPLGVALQWCCAVGDIGAIESFIVGCDMRAAMELARVHGLWLSSYDRSQVSAIEFLVTQDPALVSGAVRSVNQSMGELLPTVVAQQLFGVGVTLAAYPWVGADVAFEASASLGKSSKSRKGAGYAASSVSKKTRRVRAGGGWRKKSRSKSAPVADTRTSGQKAWESLTQWPKGGRLCFL